MTKFILSTAQVRTLTAIVVLTLTVSDADHILRARMPEPAVISNIYENYVKPYVKSIQVQPLLYDTQRRMLDDSIIERAIKQKIIQLKPVLDENSNINAELSDDFQDEGETTILEFSPASKPKANDDKNQKYNMSKLEPLQNSIDQYKMTRQQIGKLLNNESVSDKAKTLVTKTLDQMIAQMIRSQCNWKTRPDNEVGEIDKKALVKSWKNKWEDLIERFSLATPNPDADGSSVKEMYLFLMRLREFFFEIHNELNMRPNDRFQIKCNVIDTENPKKTRNQENLRQRPESNEDFCKYVHICSEELKNFLMDFYIYMKETVDIVFKNYVEMYKRDINTDVSKEQRTFVALLNDVNSVVDKRIDKTFKRQTHNLKLGEHNTSLAKIKAIKKYIKTTILTVQKLIEKDLSVHLKPLSEKTRTTVKQDLITNLGIELGNFEKDFSDKTCTSFVTCNGNTTRRMKFNNKRHFLPFDNNNIYVKLQLGIDGIESLRKSASDNNTVLGVNSRDTGYNRFQRSNRPPFDPSKYLKNKPTRTTHSTPTKKRKTKKKGIQRKPRTKKIEVLTKSTYTYSDYRKKMKLGKIKPLKTTKRSTTPTTKTTTIPESTTLSYIEYIRKLKADGKFSPYDPYTFKITTEKMSRGDYLSKIMP